MKLTRKQTDKIYKLLVYDIGYNIKYMLGVIEISKNSVHIDKITKKDFFEFVNEVLENES